MTAFCAVKMNADHVPVKALLHERFTLLAYIAGHSHRRP
jgi:hypothetical protein